MQGSRRARFLAGSAAVAAAAFVRHAAESAEFTFKLATTTPVTHPVSVRAREAAERIRVQSNGRLEIGLFPNNVLGGPSALILQLRSGALEMLISDNSNLMTVIPALGTTLIPFAFKNDADVWNALDGPLGTVLRAAIAKTDPAFHPFTKSWGSGFRQVSNSVHPIQTQADLRGLKIRVPGSSIFVDTFKALGAVPTPIEVQEIYVALQTHLVDGADVTLSAVDSGKYYEVVKYLSVTNHLYQALTLLANSDAWTKLPPALQRIVETNLDGAAVQDRADVAREDATLRAGLQTKGLAFNDAASASFRASLQSAGLYAKWRGQFGADAWAALEKTAGKLA